MKKSIKFFAMAIMALVSMSACNNEMEEQASGSGKELQPVQFNMAMTNTRTVTDAATRVTSWKTGDAIGIFALPAGETEVAKAIASNAKYVLAADDVWKAEAGSEIYPEVALDYYAYYPYQADVTDPKAIAVVAKLDQSATTGDDYGASDVLAGQTKNVAIGAAKVTIAFKHMFAMVEVKVEGNKVTKQPTKVELKGIKLNAVLNIMAATPAATVKADATAQDVNMYYLAKPDANPQVKPFSFRAVVPAQEIAASTPLVAIYAPDDADKTYTMQHTAAVPYTAGVFRQLNVNIGTAKVSLTIPKGDLTIDPWTPSDPIGGEGGEAPLINKFGTELTSVTDNPFDLTEDTWFFLKAKDLKGSTATASIESDANTTWGKFAKLTFTSSSNQGGSWFVAPIGYYYTKPVDVSTTTIYKVTLKIKADHNGTAMPKHVFTIRNAANTASFQVSANADLSGNAATTVTKEATNSWTEFSFYVNFAKKANAVGSATLSDSEIADYAKFDFRVYTNTSKTTVITDAIYISDIVIEPYIVVVP